MGILLWKKIKESERARRKAYEKLDFCKYRKLLGAFQKRRGGADKKSLRLQPVGWGQFLDNVREIIVDYSPPQTNRNGWRLTCSKLQEA